MITSGHKERRPFKNEQFFFVFFCLLNLHLHEERHIVPPRSSKKNLLVGGGAGVIVIIITMQLLT